MATASAGSDATSRCPRKALSGASGILSCGDCSLRVATGRDRGRVCGAAAATAGVYHRQRFLLSARVVK